MTDRELNIVWYGHASTLVEIEGRRVLLDPVWSDRCSPSRLVGPRRLHPMPVRARRAALLDAIVISHDHYDHLDMATVRELTAAQRAPFLVPLGVGAHLRPLGRAGRPDRRARLGRAAPGGGPGDHGHRRPALLRPWPAPRRHALELLGGRRGATAGSSTPATPATSTATPRSARAHGPFDADADADRGVRARPGRTSTCSPRRRSRAHLDLRGELLVPVHWATFNLALHAWAEPVDRLWREAKARRTYGWRCRGPANGWWSTTPQRPEPWWRAVT